MPTITRVVITVPHAVGDHQTEHDAEHSWDFTAATAAEELRTAIAAAAQIPVSVHMAQQPRSKIDMNRPWSRTTAWRRAIAESSGHAPHTTLVIDVHSFPPGHPAVGASDLAIVTGYRPCAWHARLAAAIVNANAGVDVKLIVSPSMCDIAFEAANYGCPSVMFEFSEGRAADYPRLCRAIAAYITRPYAVIGHQQQQQCPSSTTADPNRPCTHLDPRIKCMFTDTQHPHLNTEIWIPPSANSDDGVDDGYSSDTSSPGRRADSRAAAVPQVMCFWCKRNVATHVCKRCYSVAYCSEGCELDAWRRMHWAACGHVAPVRHVSTWRVPMPDATFAQFVSRTLGAVEHEDDGTTADHQAASASATDTRASSDATEAAAAATAVGWRGHHGLRPAPAALRHHQHSFGRTAMPPPLRYIYAPRPVYTVAQLAMLGHAPLPRLYMGMCPACGRPLTRRCTLCGAPFCNVCPDGHARWLHHAPKCERTHAMYAAVTEAE